MHNPNAIVSTTVRIEPPLDRPPAEMLRTERGLSVELEGGRRVRLDAANPRSAGFAQILDGLSKHRLPVYLEIDPAATTITRLLIPHVTRVIGIRPIDEGVLSIELDRSHARHVLRQGAPDFSELERQLRESLRTGAPIILTEDDAHEIIHIRGYTPGPEGPPPPFPRPGLPPPRIPWPWRWLIPIWCWCWWPWWWFCCISATRAQ